MHPARRLAGSVEVKYDITIPDGASTPSADDTLASLSEVTAEELTTMVREELASVGVTISVQVTETAAPTKQTITERITTTPSEMESAAFRVRVASLGLVAWAIAGLS